MPKRSSTKSEQIDVQEITQRALNADSNDSEAEKTNGKRDKNPAAIALGSLGGLMGWQGPGGKTYSNKTKGNCKKSCRCSMEIK